MPSEKITFFLQDLAGGGAERSVVNIMNYLAEQGYPIDLVLVRREGPFLEQVSPKVDIVPLRTKRVLFSPTALARYLRKEQPVALLSTIVHVNVAAVIAKFLAQTRTRLVLRETSIVKYNRQHMPYPLVRYAYYLIPYVYPKANAIVAISNELAEDLLDFQQLAKVKEKIAVIHNPVITSLLLSRAAEPANYPWLREGTPTVLGVGRLVEAKDFGTLIRAFARVRQQHSAKLLILGEGPLRRKLQQLVDELGLSQDVDMPGFVDNPYAFMAKASVFVLSSAWEGFGNVLVEAMACGTPVISTDCPGGPRDILQDGKYGKLVPVGDSEAMAQAIFDTLENPPDTRAAQERAQTFSVERIAEQYLQVLLGENNYAE